MGAGRVRNVNDLLPMGHRMNRAAILLFMMFAVAGCENPWARLQKVKRGF
jgi:hypothetical protein